MAQPDHYYNRQPIFLSACESRLDSNSSSEFQLGIYGPVAAVFRPASVHLDLEAGSDFRYRGELNLCV